MSIICREDLPQDLVSKIFQKLVELEGIQQAGKMRLVSKAWLNACTQYPADVACDGRQSIEALCKALPRMTRFRLVRQGDCEVSLQPLQALEQLTMVVLFHMDSWTREQTPGNSAEVDFSHLPPNIALLELLYVYFIPDSISAVRFTELRALTCTGLLNEEDDVWTLLGSFPQLQELHLHGFGYIDMEGAGQVWQRMPDLTYLDLGTVAFEDSEALEECPTTLSKLKLDDVCVEDTWLNKYFSTVPQLTALYLDGTQIKNAFVDFGEDEDEDLSEAFQILTLPASLKSLVVRELWDLPFTSLPCLESFVWRLEVPEGDMISAHKTAFLASLTSLTCLELYETPPWEGAEALRDLPQLRKLALVDCCGLELELLLPGALTTLTSLHIEAGKLAAWHFADRLWFQARPWVHEYVLPHAEIDNGGSLSGPALQRVREVREAIKALPHLKELTGSGHLFDDGGLRKKGLAVGGAFKGADDLSF